MSQMRMLFVQVAILLSCKYLLFVLMYTIFVVNLHIILLLDIF